MITSANPTLASYATPTGIHFRLTAKAASESKADLDLQQLEDKLLARLGNYFFARDEDTMQDVVGRLLLDRHLTLATAESCTGGLAANWITNVRAVPPIFVGGVIPYNNELKINLLQVPKAMLDKYGAVSAEVAEAMAFGVRQLIQADIGAAATGIAGPGGGSAEKPIGLVYIAVADTTGACSRCYQWSGVRDIIKRRTAQALLNLVRQKYWNTNWIRSYNYEAERTYINHWLYCWDVYFPFDY